jgi:dolichol-phosphate mannosyltransferase
MSQCHSYVSSKTEKVLVTSFAFNEGVKIQTTVERIMAATSHDVLVLDDGSTDGSIEALRKFPIQIVSNARNEGIGSAMKRAFDYALDHNYDIIVIMAGNNKDDPAEIPRLLKSIVDDGYDFVQGSRFLQGGGYGNMPFYRRFATRLHPLLFSLAVRKWVTESTNGFRAFKTSILQDPRINWRQDWLNQYELEPYLLYMVITLNYKHTEVPVTKIYPPKNLGYTKMRAVTGWWSILRPIVYLTLGIKK